MNIPLHHELYLKACYLLFWQPHLMATSEIMFAIVIYFNVFSASSVMFI